ncbi:hypothetical protein NM208_g697 [Fusarium decemcellulare]|uniref:Uncharacterized protein n=1 Tax=Fusarium decemcellulare TaxID=57161 RepID=A0ACC1SYP4_9HYPO|nr:hypothetical protein NM208_g697 [Fusarium decemcellulare]
MTGAPFVLEDYFYFAGQALYYAVATCFILGVVVGGAGHPVDELRLDLHLSHFQKIFLSAQIFYAAELLAVKISIILLMQRLFYVSLPWFRIMSWVAMALSAVWALYTALLGFLICRPIQSAWDITVTRTSCGNFVIGFSAVAVFDIVTDLVIFLPAIKIVSRLQMARPHKVALIAVFAAGFITIIFSGIRLYFTIVADFVNITEGFATASVSGVLQSGIALMVASSPMLRPVFDRTVVRWLSLSIGGSESNQTGPSGSNTRGTSRTTPHPSLIRSTGGFRQMSESEEHLAWEMQGLSKLNRAATSADSNQLTRLSDESILPMQGRGEIIVTQTTAVERC